MCFCARPIFVNINLSNEHAIFSSIPRYPDLFAVTYGGFKASKLKKGLLCLFSIKNPTFPDYVYHLEKSAMCVDINPEEPNLIAVGFQVSWYS